MLEERETISLAFLALLEYLTPQERAVFLLRDIFDYDYAEIATMLGLSAANCRQLLHRARERLAEKRHRFEPSAEEQRRLTVGYGQSASLATICREHWPHQFTVLPAGPVITGHPRPGCRAM